MRAFLTAAVLASIALTLASPAAGAGAPDRECRREVRAAGDWGRELNPGRATFVSGTAGDDVVAHVPAGVVFCGLGGDDRVLENEGWFYGGDGIDTVETNFGMTHGGADTDVVLANHGLFEGGPDAARDVVHVNHGIFDGGPGSDLVQDANFGTCIDVEVGC